MPASTDQGTPAVVAAAESSPAVAAEPAPAPVVEAPAPVAEAEAVAAPISEVPAEPQDAAPVPIDPEQLPERRAYLAASSPRALERIAGRGLEISGVIDIGASNGLWSQDAMRFWKDARYLLVEAQVGHQEALDKFVAERSNAEYVLAAAGHTEGEIFFDDSCLFGGLASMEQTEQATKRLPMITVDEEVKRRNLPGPYLLKLDTHGFELPILEGAKETLKASNLVVIETYNFQIAPGSLLFFEMCVYMKERGFRAIDISEPMWRVHDNAFWQLDFFFVREDRAEFAYTSYS